MYDERVTGPMDVMKTMHLYIADSCRDLPVKEKGIIQFSNLWAVCNAG